MVRELFLIRHAEADSTNFDIKDIERPLTTDGEIMASKVGKFLEQLIGTPDLMQSSTAVRTRQTTFFIGEQLRYNPVQVDYLEDLYEASTRILLKVINELDDKHQKVVIVAHNPAINFLSEYITGAIIGNVSPAGIVHVRYDGSWQEISEKNADLVKYYKSPASQ